MPGIDETIAFIRRAHAGQVDKGGVDYWNHPVSVMNRLGSTYFVMTAALTIDIKIRARAHTIGSLHPHTFCSHRRVP
jgi:hypothetical protein